MIEYRVFFVDIVTAPKEGIKSVSAKFIANAVKIAFINTAILSSEEWNNYKLLVLSLVHSKWSMVYGNTPLFAELSNKITAPAMKAFSALHVFVPEYRLAKHLEANPHIISQKHLNNLAKNSLDIIKMYVVPENLSRNHPLAVKELFSVGLFQILAITISHASEKQLFKFYFMPFMGQSVAPSELSADAMALWENLLYYIHLN